MILNLNTNTFLETKTKSLYLPKRDRLVFYQIIKKASGYYANLIIELDVDVVKPIPYGHAIGIDAGIQSMISTSDGLLLPRPRFLDKALLRHWIATKKAEK